MIAPDRFRDLLQFGRLLTRTLDNDPVYPVMKEVARRRGLTPDQVQWLIYLYLCFYNVSSAWATFVEFPSPYDVTGDPAKLTKWEEENRARLACNVERRGLRGGRVTTAIREFALLVPVSGFKTIREWLQIPDLHPADIFLELWDRLQTVRFVGRWAAFKWLDLLKHVADLPIEFPDLRMAHCSGPRQAIEELYYGVRSERQDAPYVTSLEAIAARLRNQMRTAGLDLSLDELETVLCNFHSLAHGRYYVGRDIDEMLHDLEHGAGDPSPWLESRKNVLDNSLLGEIHGWTGVRKSLDKLYLDRRFIHPGGFFGG